MTPHEQTRLNLLGRALEPQLQAILEQMRRLRASIAAAKPEQLRMVEKAIERGEALLAMSEQARGEHYLANGGSANGHLPTTPISKFLSR
jgi:hypothetical protein